jgi:hypothetical protein
MKNRKTLSSVAATALLVTAIAVPVASAMPADPISEWSTEEKSTDAFQDRRSEATADPTRAPEPPVGLPTWPLNPEVLTPPASDEPVTTVSDDGDGLEWPLSGILIAGSLLLGGTLGVAGTRYRVSHTHAA